MERTEEPDGRGCHPGGGRLSRWWNRQSPGKRTALIALAVLAGAGALGGCFVLFGHIVMWLWNWIMPYLFELPSIDFWMAWGIVLLSMILFGRASSSGSRDSGASRRRRRKIEASMEAMSTEEHGGER